MGGSGKVTIKDVANLAGVSRATVSRVLNGTAGVSPVKAAAVRSAVEATGFLVSKSARQLATGRTDSLAVILTEPIDELLIDPTYATVLKGIMDGLADTPLTPSLYMMATDQEREKSLRLFRRGAVDAIVHLSPYTHDSLLDDLAEIGIPTVLCGQAGSRDDRPSAFSRVYSDDVEGARRAARHLTRRGANSVCALMGPADNPATADRLTGLRDVLGTRLRERPGFGNWEEESGFRMADDLVRSGIAFDALACGNDRIAVGAIRRLQVGGLRVPDDVLIIGFDDHPIAAAAKPSITSVHQPFHLQGRRSVEIAEAMLAGEPPVVEVLGTEVVARESTGDAMLRTPGDPGPGIR